MEDLTLVLAARVGWERVKQIDLTVPASICLCFCLFVWSSRHKYSHINRAKNLLGRERIVGVLYWGFCFDANREKLWIPPFSVLCDGSFAAFLSGCTGLGSKLINFLFSRHGASVHLVKLLPVSSFLNPGSAGLAVSCPWRFSFGVLRQLYLVLRLFLMISIEGIMQVFSEKSVGSLVQLYNALVMQPPADNFKKTSSRVEVCKCIRSLL